MKKLFYINLFIFCLLIWSCTSSDSSADKTRQLKTLTTPSGLKYIELAGGTGQTVKSGQTVAVHYIGTLDDGTEFDNSRKRGTPIEFRLGAGRVIKGWDEGIVGMKVGGQRKLIIPPELGYGSRNVGKIPANSTLIFEVELVEIK
jgi:peptidylprolyl isomerase